MNRLGTPSATAWVALSLISAGCAPGAAGPSGSGSWVSEPASDERLTPAPSAATPVTPSPASSAATPPAVDDADPFSGASFPPPSFEPPHERSAKPGDGEWVAVGDPTAGDRVASSDDPPLMVQSIVRPHPVSSIAHVRVVAIDLARVSLHLVAGTEEPETDAVDEDARSGLVPAADHASLLAVFNGGFQTRHGRWGVKIGDDTFLPAQENGCTIGFLPRGRIEVRSWAALAARQGELTAFRQTPPCLLEEAELHPDLVANRERPWGGQDPKRKTRRRSAIAIDRSGRVLMYGFGLEVGPKLFAEGLRAAGAAHAAQLDINWNWTRFLLFGTPGGGDLQVTSTLVPKMEHRKRGYVHHPHPRDFFYLARRSSP